VDLGGREKRKGEVRRYTVLYISIFYTGEMGGWGRREVL
jgi:hypothetical protein